MQKEIKKAATLISNCLTFKWCHQESNRGHKDFQNSVYQTQTTLSQRVNTMLFYVLADLLADFLFSI